MLVALELALAVALCEAMWIGLTLWALGSTLGELREAKREIIELQKPARQEPRGQTCACGGARAGLGYTHSEFICERRTVQ